MSPFSHRPFLQVLLSVQSLLSDFGALEDAIRPDAAQVISDICTLFSVKSHWTVSCIAKIRVNLNALPERGPRCTPCSVIIFDQRSLLRISMLQVRRRFYRIDVSYNSDFTYSTACFIEGERYTIPYVHICKTFALVFDESYGLASLTGLLNYG